MSISSAAAQVVQPLDANTLLQRIQAGVLNPVDPPEGKEDPAIPHGEILEGSIADTIYYPGTTNDFRVYVPAQYDPAKPACLLVKMDGLGDFEAHVLDHLIASKEVPVMIAVGVSPGHVFRDGKVVRFNRCFQYDSMNDRFPEFLLNALLPQVVTMKTNNGRPVLLSKNPDDRMATGASSGGICTFNLAWRRPDQFHRVYDNIGTFVAMRGGHEFPALIRKTESKPIRVFLEDGSQDAWNYNLGSWFEANTQMESALKFAGYDVTHAWGTHGHDGSVGGKVFPDVMRWMWRDYPAPITAGMSQNDKLGEVLASSEGWERLPQIFASATSLAVDARGGVWIADSSTGVFKIGSNEQPVTPHGSGINAIAFGSDGTLYLSGAEKKRIVRVSGDGASHPVADGVAAHRLIVTHDGTIYATEPGDHSDMPSTIWRIKPNGTKEKVDEGLHAASGLVFAPDGALFFAAENSTKWIYSFVFGTDGKFSAKQPFDWLHITDLENDSGAEDLAFDRNGNLYVATRMGVQICDQNGRVRAIIPLPTPCGSVTSLCFGGVEFDELYVTDGKQVFKRKMKVPGYQQWMAPVDYPSQGEG